MALETMKNLPTGRAAQRQNRFNYLPEWPEINDHSDGRRFLVRKVVPVDPKVPALLC